MQIREDALREFIRIYEEEYQERLTVDEAREMASRVLTLYKLLAQPLPGECEGISEQAEDEKRATDGRDDTKASH